jgi:hypothetical protein
LGVESESIAHRVIAYNPTEALDVGLARDATAPARGLIVPSDLMQIRNLPTLEARTAYLLEAYLVHQSFVGEWNQFRQLQENLWLKIYRNEGLIDLNSPVPNITNPLANATAYFTELGGLEYMIGSEIYPEKPAWIRDVDRFGYHQAITQWLTDSGTTARSGGIAVDNDTYIGWLIDRLSTVTTDRAQVADLGKIHPLWVYRYAPTFSLSLGTGGDDGPSGAPPDGDADPSDDANGRNELFALLQKLESSQNPLTAELSGGDVAPINTLPDC